MTKDDLFKVSDLRKLGKIDEALAILSETWKANPALFAEWDYFNYQYCLLSKGKSQDALDISRVAYYKYPQFEPIGSQYARSIYYTQFFKKEENDFSTIRRAVLAMLKLSPPTQPYSLTSKAIFKLCKMLGAQQQIDWNEIEAWIDQLDPDLLDSDPFNMMDEKGKMVEYASPQEVWFSWKIKCQAGLNRPKALLDMLEAVRKKGLKWHYNNDIWFGRKEAFALAQMGRKKEAIKKLRTLLLQKKEWFMMADLASLLEEGKEVMDMFSQAALFRGYSEMKINLFQKTAEAIEKYDTGNTEIIRLHYELIVATRNEHIWEIGTKLEEKCQLFGIALNASKPREIYKSLVPYWESLNEVKKVFYEGVIEKLLKENNSGFIKTSKQEKYYFSIAPYSPLVSKLKMGSKLRFELVDGFDKKKNVPSKMAVNLTLI